ncbi:hypothetical protein ABT160_28795 [Streptomyces sp. NPDC001941]|uniref:hypothetical protein n=1 Tax=Streptomyces sp. NPDC001941 TaxID=3154659 RepID=UPI00332FA293
MNDGSDRPGAEVERRAAAVQQTRARADSERLRRQQHRREVEAACDALAVELRTLVGGLEISQNRLAQRLHMNKGTLSRYLSASQVPDWNVVLGIFEEVAHERGVPITRESWQRIHDAHRVALMLKHPMAYEVHVARDELAAGERELRSLKLRETALNAHIGDQVERIGQLEADKQALIMENVQDHGRTREERRRLQEQIDALQAAYAEQQDELRVLQEDLRRTQEEKRIAERRCEELDQRLAEAEERGADESAEDTPADRALEDPTTRRIRIGLSWQYGRAGQALEYLTGGCRPDEIDGEMLWALASSLNANELAHLFLLLHEDHEFDPMFQTLSREIVNVYDHVQDRYLGIYAKAQEVANALQAISAPQVAERIAVIVTGITDPDAAVEHMNERVTP